MTENDWPDGIPLSNEGVSDFWAGFIVGMLIVLMVGACILIWKAQ